MSALALRDGGQIKPLAEHPEFEDMVRAAAERHGMLPALVVKDYWVVRVLRAVARDATLQGRALFKGGTSLSKGWGLIDRFSEDIDLLFTGPGFGPPPETRGERERLLKHLRRTLEAHTPLRLPDRATVGREVWDFHYVRDDWHCNIRYPLPGKRAALASASSDWVLVEAGFRGGPYPHARRPLEALVAGYLRGQQGVISQLTDYAEDLGSFEMDLLKPERTFAEKILALHVDMSEGEERASQVRIRHYSDVAQLLADSADVQASLRSGEFLSLVREAANVSNRHYGTSIDVERLDLRESPALTPTSGQLRLLKAKYENPLEQALYYRGRRSFEEIMRQVASLREALPRA